MSRAPGIGVMNVKLFVHLMPWELDEAEISFQQIEQSKKYLDSSDVLFIDSCLNLSSYIIDWGNSRISKEFFIEKYNNIHKRFCGTNSKSTVYDGSELYGHLDFQKTVIDKDIDYYVCFCPDMYFHKHLLFYLIESAKQIKDKYFVITPQTSKLWDYTWDVLVNKKFIDIEYNKWNNQSVSDRIYFMENNNEEPCIEKLNVFKWAGWFDLYNKNFYEKFVPIQKSWVGYGPWDTFGTTVSTYAKKTYNTNVEQYLLKNQIIFDKNIGSDRIDDNVYKKFLKLNDIPNQRNNFQNKFNDYIKVWHTYSMKNNLL